MCLSEVIIKTLKNEVMPAMGCTEPVAVALACAKAKEIHAQEEIERVEVWVSPNIYKNGLGVGVPNTKEVGLHIAAALGMVGCNSEKSLKLLEDIREDHVEEAHRWIEDDKVRIAIKNTEEKIYVEANVYSLGHHTRVVIQNKHNFFTLVQKDEEVFVHRKLEDAKEEKECTLLYQLKVREIIGEIEKIRHEDLSFLLEGIEMNEGIALEALEKKLGLGVGLGIKESIRKGILSDDLMNNTMMMTAAAADARMSGLNMPVMSSNGSGNNGLTAILPIAVYRKKFDIEDERIAKALAISHIVNCYIKKHIGRLSALCGCGVAAATGASAAIAWLMGGDYDKIDGAIKNMIANISGMICDGAKGSCALKVSTAASVAIQSALLALNDSITLSRNGIIADSAEDTIRNLGILSKEGMDTTDRVILEIMKEMA